MFQDFDEQFSPDPIYSHDLENTDNQSQGHGHTTDIQTETNTCESYKKRSLNESNISGLDDDFDTDFDSGSNDGTHSAVDEGQPQVKDIGYHGNTVGSQEEMPGTTKRRLFRSFKKTNSQT